MSKFRKKVTEQPEVSTASLPDIVFMLLFFFMTVTVMKDTALKVENELPNASEVKKLEKKDRIITIYVGGPNQQYRELLGETARIQLEDKFADVSEVGPYVLGRLAEMPEALRPFVTISLKVDKRANMGLVIDIKEVLRDVGVFKINYTTYEGDAFMNVP